MSGAGLTLLEDRIVKSKTEAGLQFDPLIIISVISAIVNIIAQCYFRSPASLRRRPLNRLRLAMAIRKEVPGMSFAEAFAEADNAFDLADKATDAELTSLIEDCGQ